MQSGKRNSKGSVIVNSFRNRLRLQLPRQLFNGKQKYLTLGLDDTPGNRQIAEAKAKEIERDIQANILVPGTFDYTLNKYRPESFRLVEAEKSEYPVSLNEIWEQFIEHKKKISSPSTMRFQYRVFSNYLSKLPTHDLEKAVEIRDWVLSNIPPESAKRFIVRLSACCDWAIESQIITNNPFKGMSSKITIPKSQKNDDGEINPFSVYERDLIIEAFRSNKFCSKYSRVKHSYYADYVEFLFLTGCRPSEAIALERKNISSDFRYVTFDSAVVLTDNGLAKKSGLKTQEKRRFPVNQKLKPIIERVCEGKNNDDILFPSPQEKTYIDTGNFRNRVWKPVLDGLGIEYRKPYQTRHTFITLALENGLDAKDVARLVGNSPEIIYKHYAGNKRDLFVPEF
ncbi:tyrosine-type recombinase/integrase [Calothrix sp. FACHB-1219]|uniref:site-specific integrase n=1 Tax=unclassified Calothrix TaxID=2619626 RepID=UPI0016827C7B|nr:MULTISPECIES: site-specific integrase [unclassified Calothrix]MBD2203732.1 tyrosine-type recombinase/integrase [Calothrix sp. FACHB-168]MBD2219552.1 tyrosine-type recombinase/integrase [Calothrix sp. FACHB-1219]